MRQAWFASLCVTACLAGGEGRAQLAPSAAPGWQFVVTPYLWVPSVDATLRYGVPPGSNNVRNADVAVDSFSVVDALKFAALISGEARHGRFSVLADLVYLDLGSSNSAVRSVDFVQAGPNPVASSLNAGTESSLSGTLLTLAGGYTVADGAWGNLDLTGGLRYLRLSATTEVRLSANVVGPGTGQVFARTGRLSDEADLLDAIIGVRGRVTLGAGFHIPYAVDIGTGSSSFTWQALAGIGYQTGWGSVTLGYRHLSYEQGDDKLVQDLSLGGPFLGTSFRF